MAKKRKRIQKGHYCKVCDQYKANEKFSGKGHNNHICKSCSELTQIQRNEKTRISKIEKIQLSGFFMSKENQGLLKRYVKDKRYNEAAEYAKMVLEEYDERMAQHDEAKKQDEGIFDDYDDLDFIDQE